MNIIKNMATTFQSFGIVFGLLILLLFFGIAIWFYTISHNYQEKLNLFAYTRGAHAGYPGKKINMICEPGKKICIERATQICSTPDENNFEDEGTDSISSGVDGSGAYYGNFNPNTTVDLKKSMTQQCGGKESCEYTFYQSEFPGKMSCEGNTQLIATYTCIPENKKCL